MRFGPLQDLSPRQQELSDRISGRRGATRGPYLVWLRSPELCDRVEALASYCRYDSVLDVRISELLILIAAQNFDAPYSWNAHVEKAIEAGVARGSLDKLARNEPPAFDKEDEAAAYAFADELLSVHHVSDETFQRALDVYGEHGVVDILGALGYFHMLAMLLNAAEVDLPTGQVSPFALAAE